MRGFRQIRSSNGNVSGIWHNVSRASTWTCVRGKFGGNRSKESGRSGASFTSQKNNASATHFFALSPKLIARFRLKRARLSLFRRQPYLPSFIEVHPSFRDLLAKTTFQIAEKYIYMNAYDFVDKFSSKQWNRMHRFSQILQLDNTGHLVVTDMINNRCRLL